MSFRTHNPFIQSIAYLASGTVVAHAITLAAMPMLTRLYSPADYTTLAIFSGILAILISLSTLNLQLAIPVSKNDEEAVNVLAAALLVLAGFSILLSLLVLFPPPFLRGMLEKKDMATIGWMLVPGCVLGSTYVSLQMWATRRKAFKAIAGTKVTRALGSTSTQIGFGLTNPSTAGLVIGHLVYNGAGVFGLFRNLWNHDKKLLKAITKRGIKQSITKHRGFITLTTPGNFLNIAGIHIPILIVGLALEGSELGQFALASQVMAVPMVLIGASVGQVFYSEAPKKYEEGILTEFTRTVSIGLLKTGGPVFIVIGLTAPILFPWVFGKDWAPAGVLISWMTPWFILQFVCSPVSSVLYVIGEQKTALWIQFIGTAVRLGTTALAIYFTPEWALEAFVVSSAVFYGIYIIVAMNKVKSNEIHCHC